jgi:hypothetical protein
MNLLKVGLLFASVLFAVSAHAERAIAEIFQPTSLLGTDTDDEPLKDGQIMAATILSRPILIAGAFPESPVAAMCLPHKITGATDGVSRRKQFDCVGRGEDRCRIWRKVPHDRRGLFAGESIR